MVFSQTFSQPLPILMEIFAIFSQPPRLLLTSAHRFNSQFWLCLIRQARNPRNPSRSIIITIPRCD